MEPVAKVLFLGIDAGDKYLLQSWAADGTLPVFRSLLETGLTGDSVSIEGFFEGSTWPSFYTGVTPARHGFHRMVQLRPGTYDFHRCLPGDFIPREPFWNTLSRNKRKVAILDIPLSGVSRRINGIQMVEWGSHDAVYGFQAQPEGLRRKVLSRFGHHPVRAACDSFGRSRRLAELRDLLIEGVKKKTRLTRHYLGKGGWDFFAQVFTEGHCIGHQCFHLHNALHPSHDTTADDLMRDVYVAIDTAVGEILNDVDDRTVVVLLATHRMSHNFGAQFLLPEILVRLKAAEGFPLAPEPGKERYSQDKLDTVLGWFWRRVPLSMKEHLMPVRDRLRVWFDDRAVGVPGSLRRIDMKRSRCFPLDNGLSVGGIRLNLAGREPNGILLPGKDADIFCDQLARDLLGIVDSATGMPMVKSVKRTSKLYEGERLDHLPDLLVEWNDEKMVGAADTGNPDGSVLRLGSDKIGIVEGTNTYCRTGDHRPEGLFVARGRGIGPGRLERTVSIMDFAPTFTGLLGVALPGIDGKPIAEIVGSRSPGR